MQLFLVLAESELPSTEKASLLKKSVLSRLSFIPVLCCQTTWDRTLYGKKLLRPSHPSAVHAAGTQDRGHTSWPIALPWHAALCPHGPAWICPCRHMLSPYLTSARRPRLLLCQCLHPVCSSPLLTFATGRHYLGRKPAFSCAFFSAASVIPETSRRHAAPEPLRLAPVWG